MKQKPNIFTFMSMKIIAESGSTKCFWKCSNEQTFQTVGLNPYQADETLLAGVMGGYPTLVEASSSCSKLIFFGAGCGPDEAANRMKALLLPYFPNAEIEILSDMEAAAKVLLGNQNGLVGIMGTGSNVGYYEAATQSWHYQIPSLGWALADEGGGVSLGKALIKAFTRKKLSSSVLDQLQRHTELELAQILNNLYRQPLPNRFLASFSPLILNLSHEKSIVQEVIQPVFHEFARELIFPTAQAFQCYELNLVGSVAFHYQEFIRDALNQYGISLNEVCSSPIDRLTF